MQTLPRRAFLAAAAGAVGFILCGDVCAAETGSPPPGRRFALSGYDPVAYFTDGRPEKGASQFWFAFDDAIYLFRSAEHRGLFAADPERYAPQYAGFCAGGVSKGYKIEPDPEAWMIVSGKLFVFQFKDKVENFKRDLSFIDRANTNWPTVRETAVRK